MNTNFVLQDRFLEHFFAGLAYALQNVEKIRLFPRMLEPLDWDTIKVFFQSLARMLLVKIKPD